jgi:flagellar hook-associated protein 3 FlgL
MERISNLQRTNSLMEYLFDTKKQVNRVNQEIASNYKVIYGSDAPGSAGMISSFQSKLERLDKHEQRIVNALSLLDTQEKALEQASDILVRASELATQAANETLSSDQRKIIGEEILGLKANLVNVVNQQYVNSYLYGGGASSQPPIIRNDNGYDEPLVSNDTSARYTFAKEPGHDITNTIYVSDTEQIRLNTPAEEVFSSALNTLERLGRVLKGYHVNPAPPAAPNNVGTAYTAAEYSQQTEDIRQCIDLLKDARVVSIENEKTSIGVRTNQLMRSQDVIETLKVNIDTARSGVQDIDLYEAANTYTSLQTSLQALLQMGSQINSLSLMNFLK